MPRYLPDGSLTYPGDVTGNPAAQPGHLLGHDETFRFYEVLDAEFHNPEPDVPDYVCDRTDPHTHVNLQYATAETLKRFAPQAAS